MILHAIINIFIAFVCLIFIMFMSMLFIPVKYKGKVYIRDDFSGEAYITWLFGLIKFNIFKREEDSKIRMKFVFCGANISINKHKKNKHATKEKKEKSKKKNQFSRKLISIFYNYLKDILGILKPEHFSVVGTYGFEDPSITGIICAFIGIINGAFPMSRINLKPVFEEEDNDIKIEVYGSIINCVIVARTLKLIMKKEVRKIIFSKKEKKCETFQN